MKLFLSLGWIVCGLQLPGFSWSPKGNSWDSTFQCSRCERGEFSFGVLYVFEHKSTGDIYQMNWFLTIPSTKSVYPNYSTEICWVWTFFFHVCPSLVTNLISRWLTNLRAPFDGSGRRPTLSHVFFSMGRWMVYLPIHEWLILMGSMWVNIPVQWILWVMTIVMNMKISSVYGFNR